MFGSRPGHSISTKTVRMLAELIENVRLNNSTQPSPTPSPEPVHESNVPEIDGSHAAFIGVMVALSAIIVICCGLVYYLLRTYPRDRDSARGLYRRPKDPQAVGHEFDADSEDEDIEKQYPRRDRGKGDSGIRPSTGQTQETTRYDDSFDPDKISANVPKSGGSVPPT